MPAMEARACPVFRPVPRAMRVKNKTPAPIQFTAEQLIREAQPALALTPVPPSITDPEELAEYRLLRRTQFEDRARITAARSNPSTWIQYASWEASQQEFARARSVWERCLGFHHTNPSVWLKYAHMEMSHGFINHARNVWDRAVSLLPRVDQLWYKYIHMEEMLGNIRGARQIFERWMSQMPDHHGWMAYINFELRYKEVERARKLYELYVQCVPTIKAWVNYAKFEVRNGNIGRARRCYERAIEQLGEDGNSEELFVAFAQFEEQCKELERARCVYRFGLDHIPKGQADDLYQKFVSFERRCGGTNEITSSLLGKKRFQYEEELKKNGHNYDVWFDYITLEESTGCMQRIREIYERAIANVPPAEEKRYWERYIYLWIHYAAFEELEAEDIERARDVYNECLKRIPHKRFSFAKMWLLAAQLEIRQKDLKAARCILGNGLGRAPKDKLFRGYIEIELQLGNIDRCRTLYKRWLESAPANCHVWCKFAELERLLQETERGRAVYELAIAQPVLVMPELLWKTYIDFEISEGDHEKVRRLYEQLLDRTRHVKVWVSYAKFEATVPFLAHILDKSSQENEAVASRKDHLLRSRTVFERGLHWLVSNAPDEKEERAMLLEEWCNMEKSFGDLGDVYTVEKQLPIRVKRKCSVQCADGTSGALEEYTDYIFPEELKDSHFKLLEAAHRWKKLRA